jgi:hypothetical protein
MGVADDTHPWNEPLTLAEVGQLTAEWLEGKRWGPSNGGSPPDPETELLVPQLAAVNRLGYVTEFSQPGELYEAGAQRATVAGFCAQPQAECLACVSLSSELVVITQYPGVDATYELPVTQEDGHTFTVQPGLVRYESDPSAWLWEGVHPHTASTLSRCHYVVVCDPRWGRNELLWPAIVGALERDPADCAGSLIDPDLFTGQG